MITSETNCDGCGTSTEVHFVCSQCQLVSYCGKACQKRHWKEGGHKQICKAPHHLAFALCNAAQKGDLKCMLRLLTGLSFALADKLFQRQLGFSLAHIAAQEGRVAVLEFLRDAKAELEAPNKDGATPAYVAAQYGHVAVLEILRDASVNLATPQYEGCTPAFVAASAGRVDALKLLKAAGADLGAKTKCGATPAYTAAGAGQVAVLELLRDANVCLEVPTDEGATAAYVAAQNGHVGALRVLHEAKLKLGAPGKNGWTPAGAAACNDHIAVLKFLYDAEVDLNAGLTSAMTPAHIAVCYGQIHVLDFLLKANVTSFVDLPTSGITLAHTAAMNNEVNVLRFLFERGANLAASAKDGTTPLDIARLKGLYAAIDFLERVTAVPSVSRRIISEYKCPENKKCCDLSDEPECANCSAPEVKNGLKLLPCSRCKLVSYCGKPCQAQHWKAGGHKQRCVAVRDRTVAAAEAAGMLSPQREDCSSEKCVICLEQLASGAILVMGCGHELHAHCSSELKKSGAARVCPICRSSMLVVS